MVMSKFTYFQIALNQYNIENPNSNESFSICASKWRALWFLLSTILMVEFLPFQFHHIHWIRIWFHQHNLRWYHRNIEPSTIYITWMSRNGRAYAGEATPEARFLEKSSRIFIIFTTSQSRGNVVRPYHVRIESLQKWIFRLM